MDEEEGVEMAEQSTEWISKHWQILVTIVCILIWGIRLESSSNSNTEKNYRLYLQFDEFKKSYRDDNKELSKVITDLKIAVNTLSGNIKGLDDRYPLRREIDARLLKTAYRED